MEDFINSVLGVFNFLWGLKSPSLGKIPGRRINIKFMAHHAEVDVWQQLGGNNEWVHNGLDLFDKSFLKRTWEFDPNIYNAIWVVVELNGYKVSINDRPLYHIVATTGRGVCVHARTWLPILVCQSPWCWPLQNLSIRIPLFYLFLYLTEVASNFPVGILGGNDLLPNLPKLSALHYGVYVTSSLNWC